MPGEVLAVMGPSGNVDTFQGIPSQLSDLQHVDCTVHLYYPQLLLHSTCNFAGFTHPFLQQLRGPEVFPEAIVLNCAKTKGD